MPELHITMKQQEGPNWCYSSVIEAIVKYYNKIPNNTQLTQHNIATIVAGKCINGMQDPYNFLDKRGYIAGISTGKLSWKTITQEIDSGHPIILLVGQHYILLIGYNGKSSKDSERTLVFLDPLLQKGGPVIVSGTDFVNNGFSTDYKYTGIPQYERQRGYILTK